ncbi:uncharacterized protein LOC118478299 isoform X2 [Aplysia californica]|uniref:Uncharacterized protein LOC118478299 isoform X2 n=1 Tax=Aplysia californica TaxID=6500 RepID=A0ABM1VYS3_APLCA|nr:uncharacterized protein LOC118478299 isoform X2 [Aplysia californica]
MWWGFMSKQGGKASSRMESVMEIKTMKEVNTVIRLKPWIPSSQSSETAPRLAPKVRQSADIGHTVCESSETNMTSRLEGIVKTSSRVQPEAEVSKRERDAEEFCKLLRLPKILLWFGALKVPTRVPHLPRSESQRCCGKVLFHMFQACMFTMHVLNMVRVICLCVDHIPSSEDTSRTMAIGALTFMLFGQTLYISEHWTLMFRFQKFQDHLWQYNRDFGFLHDLTKHKKFVFFLFVSGAVNKISFTLGWLLFGIINHIEFIVYPFKDIHDIRILILGSLNSGITYFLSGVPVFGFFVLYTVILHVLVHEFKATAEVMRQTLSGGDGGQMEVEFDQHRARHSCLAQVVTSFSHQTQTFVTLTLIFLLMDICLCVYGVSSWQANTTIIGCLTSVGAFLVFTVCALVILWTRVHTEAHSIVDVVDSLEWTKFPPPVLRKVSLLLTHISNTKIGVNVFGMFVLDYSTLMMIFGTVATYGVVVLQFQLDKTSSIARCQNGTFV